MKTFHALSLFVLLAFGASILTACGSSPAAPVSPTTVATLVPTSAPTSLPPPTTAVPSTPQPTVTSEPTNTPAPVIDMKADKAVRDAFGAFQSAQSYRLQARAELSPIFFQGNYTPAPGDDPNKVTLFVLQGEQNGTELHYALSGFLASFIGLVSGFDPDKTALEITNVGGRVYMRGTLPDESQARWYLIPADRTESTRFSPQDLLAPLVQAVYPDSAFADAGRETLGNQTCNIYTATRAAFDAVLPRLAQVALFNDETLAAGTIDRAEYKLWVCPDGKLYRIRYNFDAHTATDATKKGSFALEVDIMDYDSNIVIQAPADAVPFVPDTTGTQTAPATPLTATPVTTPVAFTSIEGDWEGTSGTDSPLNFTVENNKVTFALLNYSINTGSCTFGGAYGSSTDDGTITNGSFSVVLTNSDGVIFTFKGTINSNNEASGTLHIKGKTFCGDTDAESSWTAKHTSSPESPTAEPTEEPTQAPTLAPTGTPTVPPTPPPTATATRPSVSGTQVVTQVFDALARRDVEGVLSFFDDNVVYTIGTTTGVGKDSLRSNLQFALNFGTTFQVSNIQDLGGVTTFSATATGFGGGTFPNSSVILQDGKIMILTIK